MIEEIKLCDKSINSKYIRNMNTQKGKSNIHCEIDENNEYDNKAISIFTFNRKKEKKFISYICKNEFGFTKKSNKLYEELQDKISEVVENVEYGSEEYYQEVNDLYNQYKSLDGYGETEIIGNIYTEEELNKIQEDINNDLYNFRYEYDSNYPYLFKKEIK